MRRLFEAVESSMIDSVDYDLKYLEKSEDDISRTLTIVVEAKSLPGIFISYYLDQYLDILICPDLKKTENNENRSAAFLDGHNYESTLKDAKCFIFEKQSSTGQLLGRDILNDSCLASESFKEKQLIEIIRHYLKKA